MLDRLEAIRQAADQLEPERPLECVCRPGSPEHVRFLGELDRLRAADSGGPVDSPPSVAIGWIDAGETDGLFTDTLAELVRRHPESDVPIIRMSHRDLEPSTDIEVGGLLRTIGTRRRCAHPVGLVLDVKGGFEILPAPCRKCEPCREWERTLDGTRVAEAIPDPVLTYVSDDRWDTTRKSLQRAGLRYLTVPVTDGRRAVITEAGYRGPVVGPVDDLAGTLEQLDRKRDRGDRRRVSSSGLRTRDDIETEVYQRLQPEERSVVGFWSPRSVSASQLLEQVNEDLLAAVEQAGVPHEPRVGSVLVKVARHDPRAELLWRRLAVLWLKHAIPWYEGGPPPAPGDADWASWEAAKPKAKYPFDDDVPLEAYRDVVGAYEEAWKETATA